MATRPAGIDDRFLRRSNDIEKALSNGNRDVRPGRRLDVHHQPEPKRVEVHGPSRYAWTGRATLFALAPLVPERAALLGDPLLVPRVRLGVAQKQSESQRFASRPLEVQA